jgi:hypothetical protein
VPAIWCHKQIPVENRKYLIFWMQVMTIYFFPALSLSAEKINAVLSIGNYVM